MWLLPRVLSALALASGDLFTLLGLAFVAPRFSGVAQGLGAGAILMRVWMVWTGVVLWRARPRAGSGAAQSRSYAGTPV